jgi:diaminopimelate decarboxylase
MKSFFIAPPIRFALSLYGLNYWYTLAALKAYALDDISQAENLPGVNLGDLLNSENIGAYTHASSTFFNGFPPTKVIHINQF